MNSLVSIIIPVLNRAQMVRDAVQSAIDQTYRPIEVIVIDDGSTDDTSMVIQEFQEEEPNLVRVFSQQNSGPGMARNRGLEVASGEYIQYLDSDDLFLPDKLIKQVAALEENAPAGVSYCVTLREGIKTQKMAAWKRTGKRIENIFPSFLPERGWATLTPLWRRSVCEQIGPWENYRVMEDWHHDLRAGILGVKPIWVDEPLCVVRDHAGDRASGMNSGFTTPLARDFFRAHESIWLLMKDRALTDWSYLEEFSRKMFWIARMCGERGLRGEAERALEYAQDMYVINGKKSDIGIFQGIQKIVGWKVAARLADAVHAMRWSRTELNA